MFNNEGFGHWLIDIACLGSMFFLGRSNGRQEAIQEIEQKKQADDIAELKKMFAEILKAQK